MPRHIRQLSLTLLLCLIPAPAVVADGNFLELELTKHPDGAGGFVYGFGGALGKLGATTCEVTTPSGTEDCVPFGNKFLFSTSFFEERTFATFAGLFNEIETDWTLIWDNDLPTQTLATIDFITERGDITADDWFGVFPSNISPPNGATVPPDVIVEWDYGPTDPSAVDPNQVGLLLRRGDEERRVTELNDCQDAGDCGVTSWDANPDLALGDWHATVSHGFDIRDTNEGISSTGDPWVLENQSWLRLGSVDRSAFTVVPECEDGLDNDDDGLIDYPDDPGCFNPSWFKENPQCQDGVNNDTGQDSLIDWDGGDPQCRGPWDNNERCGLGAELAFLLPPLMWLSRRRGRRS